MDTELFREWEMLQAQRYLPLCSNLKVKYGQPNRKIAQKTEKDNSKRKSKQPVHFLKTQFH